jgi:GNAT superfamily N-acetyltransferase
LSPPITIRPAEPNDVALIFSMIVELAEYERDPESVTGTPELLTDGLFGEAPAAEALIAEAEGSAVGFALFHGTFSTWECRPGLWLEDLYVRPQGRRGGVGGALLGAVAAIAVERGCARVEWAALDWNTLALDFYRKRDARALPEWVRHRLDGETLDRVAAAGRAPRG